MIIVITNNTLISPNVHSVFLFPAMFYFSSSYICCLLNEGSNKGHAPQGVHVFPGSLLITVLPPPPFLPALLWLLRTAGHLTSFFILEFIYSLSQGDFPVLKKYWDASLKKKKLTTSGQFFNNRFPNQVHVQQIINMLQNSHWYKEPRKILMPKVSQWPEMGTGWIWASL